LIREYAVREKMSPNITFFMDSAVSGKVPLRERPAAREMCRRLRKGDHVIIAKLDRAFRSLVDCCMMMDAWSREGVQLYVCNMMGGPLDLSSPMGRFIIQILAAFAELERAFIAERIREGIAHKKKKGTRYTKEAGYGFKWQYSSSHGGKIRVQDDTEREVMRSIVAWRMQTPPVGWQQIADHLNDNIKTPTKNGTKWDMFRVRRVFQAELKLQMEEKGEHR
jgi:DNA invertase Pin-like site-specific DNA recombinase